MSDNVRIFVGTDPGAKGACGVIACVHSPLDDSRHGTVVGHAVFDLPTRERTGLDGGGEDLDVEVFRSRLSSAINEAADQRNVVRYEAVVEFPDVGGRMKGGRRQTLVQGLNAGMAFAAVRSLGIDASWAPSRSWRAELAMGDTTDWRAACAVLGAPLDDSLVILRPHPLLRPCSRTHATQSPDRCVAVLLAEVQRRRWLGTAAVPASKGAVRAAKSRRSVERKAAVKRAVAPLSIVRARANALMMPCHTHGAKRCDTRGACCQERLLAWAWRQRPEPTPASLSLGAAAVETLPRVAAIYRRASTSVRWTVAWHDADDATGTMEDEAFDALEAHGLIQLVHNLPTVRYVPTARGLEWAERLRRIGEAKADAAHIAAGLLAPADAPR